METPSAVLNNLNFGDTLLAGVYGNGARVNMLDPVDVALPIIQSQPYAFDASHLFVPEQTPEKPIEDNPNYKTAPPNVWDRIASIFSGITSAPDKLTGSLTNGYEEKFKALGKYTLVALVGLILLIFGLWIILAPTTKTIIKEAGKIV